MTITLQGSGLLTDAEVDVANRRVSQNGLSEEEAIASVKAERVGPAALTDETPAANVPGGNLAPPAVNGPEARLEDLYRQRDALDAEIATVEQDLEVRSRAYPAGGASVTAQSFAEEAPVNHGEGDALTLDSTDDQLADANASDLVAFVIAYPDQADRVREIEELRDTPRKTVLDAVGGEAL